MTLVTLASKLKVNNWVFGFLGVHEKTESQFFFRFRACGTAVGRNDGELEDRCFFTVALFEGVPNKQLDGHEEYVLNGDVDVELKNFWTAIKAFMAV